MTKASKETKNNKIDYSTFPVKKVCKNFAKYLMRKNNV